MVLNYTYNHIYIHIQFVYALLFLVFVCVSVFIYMYVYIIYVCFQVVFENLQQKLNLTDLGCKYFCCGKVQNCILCFSNSFSSSLSFLLFCYNFFSFVLVWCIFIVSMWVYMYVCCSIVIFVVVLCFCLVIFLLFCLVKMPLSLF